MCQRADFEISTKRNIKYICQRVGLVLQLSTQTKTNGLEAWSAADNTLDSNADHTQCVVVMHQEPSSQTDDWPVLDTPHREIISVSAKEIFPMVLAEVQAIIV